MSDSEPAHHNDDDTIRRLLCAPRETPTTWAVVGLSADRNRTAYGVAHWARQNLAVRVLPVHPRAEAFEGEPGYRSLADIPDGERVAVVDCFVNSAHVGAVVDQAVDQRERLGIEAVWLQLGVVDEAAAQRAADAGLLVVMDTCPVIESRRLGVPA